LGLNSPNEVFSEAPTTFTWTPVAQATSYQLEIGSVPAAADVLTQETLGTTLSVPIPVDGMLFARVKAKNSVGTSEPSNEVTLAVISFKDYVEALFLGSGPLADTANHGCSAGPGRLAAWPPGSRVTVTLGASLNERQKASTTSAAQQASEATFGQVIATVRESASSVPSPGPSEIVAHQEDVPCGIAAAAGCASPSFSQPGVFSSASIRATPSANPMAHELGHVLYGFCHLRLGPGPQLLWTSVMGSGNNTGLLSERDLAAVKAVFSAGLRGGATRSEFVAAGLVKP
jgi:hypothetical protein